MKLLAKAWAIPKRIPITKPIRTITILFGFTGPVFIASSITLIPESVDDSTMAVSTFF
ncbi:hypothetical protein D3C81_2342700 [compost metagenome]